MTSLSQSSAWSSRLADQLQVLSEVAESLTYRLLELEERLAGQEQRLQEQAATVDPEVAEEMELRLLDTEERLARMEALLADGGGTAMSRHLQPVTLSSPHSKALGSAVLARHSMGHGLDEVEIPQEDPFLDEGEQPFMDELTA